LDTYSRAIGLAEIDRLAACRVAEREAIAVDHEPRPARLARLAGEPIRRHEVERAARLQRLGEQRELLLLAEFRHDAGRARHPLHQRLERRRLRGVARRAGGREREQHRCEQRPPSV